MHKIVNIFYSCKICLGTHRPKIRPENGFFVLSHYSLTMMKLTN